MKRKKEKEKTIGFGEFYSDIEDQILWFSPSKHREENQSKYF